MLNDSGTFPLRAILHSGQLLPVFFIRLQFVQPIVCLCDDLPPPFGERGFNLIVHPGTFSPRLDYARVPHERQMAGNLGLRFVQGKSQLADAGFAFGLNEHQSSQASGVGKNVEQ